MPERQDYNTKARKYILDFLKERQDATVSAGDITDYLIQNGVRVNRATVYRYLNKLSSEKRLLKFTGKETRKSVYRLIDKKSNCGEHIHIKCVSGGKLMHLECGFMRDIKKHLSESHGFSLKCDGSILYGVCADCAKKENKGALNGEK